MRSIKLSLNGKEYWSLEEACKDFDVSYTSVHRMIKEHPEYSHETALLEAAKRKRNCATLPVALTINGIKYKNVKECCDGLGLNIGSIRGYKHRHKDLSYEQIIKIHLTSKNKDNNIEYKDDILDCENQSTPETLELQIKNENNEELKQIYIEEYADTLGIDPGRLKVYMESHRGLTLKGVANILLAEKQREELSKKDIITEEATKRNGWAIWFRGETYSSMQDCCEHYSLNYSNVINYKNANKLTFEQAMEHYLPLRDIIKINGYTYTNLELCCEDLCIDIREVYRLVNSNKVNSYTEAITYICNNEISTESEKETEVATEAITINGYEYNSILECCQDLIINHTKIEEYKQAYPELTYEYIIEQTGNNAIGRLGLCITINNEHYTSMRDCCKELGLSYNSLRSLRKQNKNLSAEETILELIKRKERRLKK